MSCGTDLGDDQRASEAVCKLGVQQENALLQYAARLDSLAGGGRGKFTEGVSPYHEHKAHVTRQHSRESSAPNAPGS